MEDVRVTVVKYPDRENFVMRFVDPHTGKQKTRSAKTSVHKDAAKAAAVWEDELRAGRYQAPSKVTWEAFRKRYEDEVLSGLADRTDEKAQNVFNSIESILSPRLLRIVNASRISHYQSKLRENGRSEHTIAGHLA